MTSSAATPSAHPLLLSTATSSATSSPPVPPTPPPPAPSGFATCDQTVKDVPGGYPTIQAAIDAAITGDTVRVAAGTYKEDVILKSGICFEGAGIDQTVISKVGASGIAGSGVSYVIGKNFTVKNSGGNEVDGGGIMLFDSSNVTILSCRLTGNTGTNGGGMRISASSNIAIGCLIDGNTASNIGGGMVVDGNSTVTIGNSTVANNVWSNPLGNGGTGGVRVYGSNVQIDHSIIWGNSGQDVVGNASVRNSDIDNGPGGTGNVSSNPNFISGADYHLQAGSPATGMGAL